MLKEPDTIPSVGVDIASLPSQLPITYNKGKKCSGEGLERLPSSRIRAGEVTACLLGAQSQIAQTNAPKGTPQHSHFANSFPSDYAPHSH